MTTEAHTDEFRETLRQRVLELTDSPGLTADARAIVTALAAVACQLDWIGRQLGDANWKDPGAKDRLRPRH